MKIQKKSDWISSHFSPLNRPHENKNTGIQTKEIQFQQWMDEYQETPSQWSQKKLQAKLQNIFDIGQKMIDDCSLDLIKNYKIEISEFIKQALGQSYQVKNNTQMRQGGKINYTHIDLVNKKVDNLVQNVLTHQKEQFNLLDQLEQIQGMLVDLLR